MSDPVKHAWEEVGDGFSSLRRPRSRAPRTCRLSRKPVTLGANGGRGQRNSSCESSFPFIPVHSRSLQAGFFLQSPQALVDRGVVLLELTG